MFIAVTNLEQFARAVGGYTLCHECARRYEPALLVELRGDYTGRGKVMHFAPVPAIFSKENLYQPRFCSSLPSGLLRWYGFPQCGYRFLQYLIKRYPTLTDRPLTERVLREVGCDVEAELAMWQLGNLCDAEQ
jgi:hypothetical protein